MNDAMVTMFSQPLWVFLAVLARISPPLMMTPPTRSSSVPMQVRAGIAIGLAALITPIAYSSASRIPGDLIHIALGMTGEVILGLALASVLLLAITSLQLSGSIIGNLAGLDLATAADPTTDEEMPLIANLMGWLAMILFILLGGHRHLLQCCMESFDQYPVGIVQFQSSWMDEMDAIIRHTFLIGIRAAAPLATALLLANLVSGLLARTLPQLNVLAIGFNINAMALLTILFVSIGGIAWLFQNELTVWLDSCHRIATAQDS
jgi:flagellar biosynthesis protein FliR